jgi:transcriptional regulator with XRE-family HTH domain
MRTKRTVAAEPSEPAVTPDDSPATAMTGAPSELGPRLRAIRLRHGVGLRELARRLDLSPSSISQIETGKMQPSVRTLYAFASEFNVTVDEVLFQPASTPGDASAAGRDAAPAAADPGLALQRAEGRPSITLNSGVTWERLMFWADEDVEFIEATYEPGGASSPEGGLVRHNGHEFGHVLSGTLRVVVGFDEFVLGPGDSVTFPSTTPHRLSNEGDEPVRAIWVVRGRRGALPAAGTGYARGSVGDPAVDDAVRSSAAR